MCNEKIGDIQPVGKDIVEPHYCIYIGYTGDIQQTSRQTAGVRHLNMYGAYSTQ